MLSIKDYAKSKGVSYEAVRKQVSRYKIELDGHIFKTNRTQYLDDDAVAFLDKKRAESPIIIMENSKDEELQRLKEENNLLKNQLLEFQSKHIKYREEIDEKLHLIAEAEAQKVLLEDKELQLQKVEQELALAKEENAKYKPSWFGLFKKVD